MPKMLNEINNSFTDYKVSGITHQTKLNMQCTIYSHPDMQKPEYELYFAT